MPGAFLELAQASRELPGSFLGLFGEAPKWKVGAGIRKKRNSDCKAKQETGFSNGVFAFLPLAQISAQGRGRVRFFRRRRGLLGAQKILRSRAGIHEKRNWCCKAKRKHMVWQWLLPLAAIFAKARRPPPGARLEGWSRNSQKADFGLKS